MDEDEEIPIQQQVPIPPQQAPNIMRIAALSMSGNFLLAFGMVFVLLGVAAFLTDALKIKGSGEVLVGLALCAIAALLLAASSRQMPKVPPMAAPPGPQKPAQMTKPDASSYR
jgi:hypothetical protein